MNKSRAAGFTLIEVMIVVVVIGILASIAYPSYREYVLRGNRAEGQAFLSEAAARQERYYAQYSSYVTTNSDRGKLQINEAKYSRLYDLAVSSVNGDGGYTLTVTQKFSDTDCGNLTLNARGVRGRSGSGKTVDECWR
ncbi:type IV pilin protein [Pseudomonas sp.]|uniref:type IV pilin protein n=1 Tax=Pseudomonas sp. TaxID=306 RepID=UPI00272CB929|nr:type IV pilin protein [Pseudomonas sp.]